jgi:hypothetical protein
LTDSNLKINRREKQNLYYDIYRYVCAFDLVGTSCLRGFHQSDLDDEDITDRFSRRRSGFYVSSFMKNLGGNWSANPPSVPMQANIDNLCNFLTVLKSIPNSKVVIGYDWGYIYTNDVSVLETLDQVPYLVNRTYSEAVPTYPKDVVLLSRPYHYTHRSYFRDRYVSQDERTKIGNFLLAQQHIKLSRSMAEYFNSTSPGRYCHMRPYWFFDHNHTGELLLMEMVMPRMIRKTLPIMINN